MNGTSGRVENEIAEIGKGIQCKAKAIRNTCFEKFCDCNLGQESNRTYVPPLLVYDKLPRKRERSDGREGYL
jgi:hypothetical protein